MCVYAYVYTDTCIYVHMEAGEGIQFSITLYLPKEGNVTGSWTKDRSQGVQ